ncbi:MAG: hypothetical protein MJ229_06155 [bacterium]|nr:hypothetical protein [bacterium]
MSKVSSTPSTSTFGSVNLLGSNAMTFGSDGNLFSSYTSTPDESRIYSYALQTLANALPSVNVFDKNTIDEIQQSVDAYRDKGINSINSMYNSALTDLKNDAVSRFGNLDNSIFANSLNDIEASRANAVSSFAQDVLSRASDLKNEELSRRYALIDALQGLSDRIYNKAINAINLSRGNAATAINQSYNNQRLSSKNSSDILTSLLRGLIF